MRICLFILSHRYLWMNLQRIPRKSRDYLYDGLRFRIIHEPRLAALQALMAFDVPSPCTTTLSSPTDDDGDDGRLTMGFDIPKKKK